ncbi:hypothetical protein D047_4156B, partial [Vibrio parahaemolyticus VPTS-2010_2]
GAITTATRIPDANVGRAAGS